MVNQEERMTFHELLTTIIHLLQRLLFGLGVVIGILIGWFAYIVWIKP